MKKPVKYQRILLELIEQEIDNFILEQAAPAPPATPPEAPTDAGAEAPEETDDAASEDENKMEKTIKSLAAKTPIDIKKTILSALQNGAEKADTEALVAYVKKKEESDLEQSEEETVEEVPENLKKAVKHIIKTFKFKVPEKAEKKAEKEEEKEEQSDEAEEKPAEAPAAPPAAPTPPAAPVKESRLQTSLREYLMYKRLSQKVRR